MVRVEPSPGGSLGTTLHDNALRYRDIAAFVDGDRSVTHAELRDRAARLAGALADLGLRRQDRIAVLGKNSVEYTEVLATAQLSGIVVATVNFRLSAPEIARILDNATPRCCSWRRSTCR